LGLASLAADNEKRLERPAASDAKIHPSRHWAFQPVNPAPIPMVKNRRWIQTPIDAFILAKLEDRGLAPAPPADRRTLLRRATYDLLGLPPAPQEIDAFLSDPAPDALAKAVER